MIRKTVNSFLLILFLFSSVGYSVSMHFCGSTKISSSIGMQAKSCCGDESSICCHNETKHYQIKDSYIAASQDINEKNKSISDLMLVVANIPQQSINDITHNEIQFIAESPPPLSLDQQLASLQTYLL